MSSVVISGNTSGAITLSAPAVAGTNTITLPAATGTVVLTGTTPTLNGITFPATQVPSADANTLDDYEEGTFDAVITMEIGTCTVASGYNKMNYTKTGRLVQIQGQFQISAVSSPAGEMKLNVPFTSVSAVEGEGLSAGAVRLYNQNIPSGASYVICRASENTSYIYIEGVVSGAGSTPCIPQTNGYFIVSITYTTAT